jgi:hypothetical protein
MYNFSFLFLSIAILAYAYYFHLIIYILKNLEGIMNLFDTHFEHGMYYLYHCLDLVKQKWTHIII